MRAQASNAPRTTPLQHLLQQRQTLLAEINDPAFNAFENVRPQLPDFRQLLTPETALIEWYLPQDPQLGAWSFIITLDQDRPHVPLPLQRRGTSNPRPIQANLLRRLPDKSSEGIS